MLWKMLTGDMDVVGTGITWQRNPREAGDGGWRKMNRLGATPAGSEKEESVHRLCRGY
jgi:hypothetical protein